jgi:ThiF family
MMTPADFILMNTETALRIGNSPARWGRLAIGYGESQQILRVAGTSEYAGPMIRSFAEAQIRINLTATWCRATADLHGIHSWLSESRISIDAALFRNELDAAAEALAGRDDDIIVTHCPGQKPELAGWLLAGGRARPLELDVLPPPDEDPLLLLGTHWPLHDLAGEVVVVGTGSIGSAIAVALAMYGLRRITLVDNDRLRWHNLVRHQSNRHAVGRYKVDAVADVIRNRWPAAEVLPLRLNVISDADLMRPLFRRCALVLCAADGVGPRRVVSHLARRAQKTAVLACVLLDGSFGEVLRMRPWPGSGCLLCQRAALITTGSMDPEPGLDAGYGTGTRHRPMTAVGTDLVLVGQFAAKLAVATLLEDAGHYDQRIQQNWAVIGLRGDLTAPPPFDLHSGEVRWLPGVGSRPDCPTCETA